MAKKKNRRNQYLSTAITVDLNKAKEYPNQYIGVFKQMVDDESDIEQMICAVSMINSMLLKLSIDEKAVRKERDLIIEAYEYAIERMVKTEKDLERIKENWFGNEPLLFRMGAILGYEKEKERIDFEYTLLSNEQKELFNKILNKTWKVREKRRVSLNGMAIQIPRTVRKEDLEGYYYGVKDQIVTFLLEYGVLTFALERPDGDIIASLINRDGNVEIVDKERLEWSYTHDAMTGKYIGAPDGEKYVEFDIEL